MAEAGCDGGGGRGARRANDTPARRLAQLLHRPRRRSGAALRSEAANAWRSAAQEPGFTAAAAGRTRKRRSFVPTAAGDIHRFHAPGSAALADRTAALEERVAQPLEMPGLLRMGLDDHRERAEEWSRIGECREELARLAKRPEPGSEEWLRDARDAARAAAAILNDGSMCRAHGLSGTAMGEEMEANAVALVREFRVHDASETLLRDWAEHAGAAAGGTPPLPCAGLRRVARPHPRPRGEGRGEVASAACPGAGGARSAGPRGPRGAQAHRAARRLPGGARRAAGAGGAKARPLAAGRRAREAVRALAPRGGARPGERTRAPRERSQRGASRGARRPGEDRARGRAHRARRRSRPPAGEGRGRVRDRGGPRPGDRPAPLLPAGAQESLRPAVGRAIPNPGRRGEGVREGRTLNAREDERAGSTAGQDEDAARGVPAGTRSLCDRRPPLRAAGELWCLAVEGRAGGR